MKRFFDTKRPGSPFLFVLVLVVVFAVNVITTHNVVNNSRHACMIGSRDKASYADSFRTIANADASAASDPKLTSQERLNRGQEALSLEANVREIDSHIAAPGIPILTSPIDRAIASKSAYSCSKTYPEPSLLP